MIALRGQHSQATAMLTFYFAPGSSSMAPHIALHEIAVPFEAKPLSFHKQEMRSATYRAINPEGKVPALLIDGRLLTEVAGILYYLAKRYPEAALLPEDVEAQAQVISWMSFVASTLHPARAFSPRSRAREIRRSGSQARQLGLGRRWTIHDRRHPPVSLVLALQPRTRSGARRIPEPVRPPRSHDGATSRAEDL